MPVLTRAFFNFAVIKQPLSDFVRDFEPKGPAPISARPTAFVLPEQPYAASPDDPPLLLWSPAAAPHLTAFMPHVSSGDYFVTASLNVPWAAVRSRHPEAEYPINEFQCHQDGQEQRFVRAFKDGERWDFFERGGRLTFEDQATYTKRLIRDRLTREMVLAYMDAWGAPVGAPDFWRSDEEASTLTLGPTD